jgi:hypothetical protein
MTLLFSSFAGDIKEKGFVLEKDSYVFTIEEAERLKARIVELEAKELELDYYKKLNKVNEQTIDLYKINEDLFKKQIENQKLISDINDDIIQKYNDSKKYNDFKTAGYFSLGVIVTIGSFIIADSISDSYISNN